MWDQARDCHTVYHYYDGISISMLYKFSNQHPYITLNLLTSFSVYYVQYSYISKCKHSVCMMKIINYVGSIAVYAEMEHNVELAPPVHVHMALGLRKYISSIQVHVNMMVLVLCPV